VDAGLRLRRIKDKFRLPAFLGYCVVAVNRELSKRLPIRRDAITEHDGIHRVSDRRDGQRRQESNDNRTLQEMFNSVSQS
jgi:hypothetical protein